MVSDNELKAIVLNGLVYLRHTTLSNVYSSGMHGSQSGKLCVGHMFYSFWGLRGTERICLKPIKCDSDTLFSVHIV